MRENLVRKSLTASLLKAACILMLVSLPLVWAEEPGYYVDSVELAVYRDGLVHVTQALTVNETFPAISVRLLSSEVENVIVVDENDTILDYETEGLDMTVFSLGARKTVIEYDTITLTQKEAGVWTLTLDTPYNLTVKLPEESTIIYLNEVPTSISTEDNRTILQLFTGQWEISYVLPIVPPRPTPTPSPTPTPTPTPTPGPTPTPSPIPTPTPTPSPTLTPGPTPTPSPSLTPTPTPTPAPGRAPIPPEYLIGVVILVDAVALFFLHRRRVPPRIEKILAQHPELRAEDREVIRFIAQKGGKVLEAEIREKFPELPRTSIWRLVKRLEKMEVVTVKRVGLQNQIELKKK